jgi:hypothetical protein
MTARLLVVMGSGETAPTMVTLHRELAAGLPTGPDAGAAVLLETPYGFQENAEDISAKAVRYFATSVGLAVTVPTGLRSPAEPDPGAAGVAADRALAAVRSARWLFAGPGSPTYALRQWSGSALGDALRARVDPTTAPAGVTLFSSAAAATLGEVALPVYEVYKVGAPPVWLVGLDMLAPLGLRAAVVPHYDNAEGGGHDTRFCYMGERRLAMLEEQLAPDAGVLGIDEHTAVIVDLDALTARVVGRGGLTVRHQGRSTVLPAGEQIGLDRLAALLATGHSAALGAAGDHAPGAAGGAAPGAAGGAAPAPAGDSPTAGSPPADSPTAGSPAADSPTAGSPTAGGPAADAGTQDTPAPSLTEGVARAQRRFDVALAARDGSGMAAAVLDVDRLLLEWSADTLQSDETDRAHAALRAMVVRLGDAADRGLRSRGALLAPVLDPLVALRSQLRDERQFLLADRLRDLMTAAGVTLQDGPDATAWAVEDR